MKSMIRIGCGAGFSGDRIEPAILLAEQGKLDYLVLECLAERTIALAQKAKQADPGKGFDPLLERRITGLLPLLVQKGIRLITNMGAANPLAAARKIVEIAKAHHIPVKVAAVTGDDVFSQVKEQAAVTTDLENGKKLMEYEIISANAYLGADAILQALSTGAEIIVTGRVADPSLFLGPMIFEFGWSLNDYDRLGRGTVIGHLLECAGQVTGGYFADGVHKLVPGLEQLGHPLAEISEDGSAVITKVEGTGGLVNRHTVREQLLYEVLNPREYITPDVVADFTTVRIEEVAENRVAISGGGGRTRPLAFKASVGYRAFFLGEGEISYAGSAALERAQLAGELIRKRLEGSFRDLRIDYIGVQSMHKKNPAGYPAPFEVRLRVAGSAATEERAALVGEEVEALYTNGPAGGGGARKYVKEVIGIVSTLIDRTLVFPQVKVFES